MKRLLIESLMAGALVVLLLRLPLDLMLFRTAPAPEFLAAGPEFDPAAAASAASLAWTAGGAAALLALFAGLVAAGARRADLIHARAVARLASAGVQAAGPVRNTNWRPQPNAYAAAVQRRYAATRPARPRKIVETRQRRSPARTARRSRSRS